MRTAFALVLVTFVPAVVRADDKADEWKGLTGTWAVAKATLGGADTTEVLATARLVLVDGKYSLTLGEQVDQGTVTLALGKKPKEMDIEGTEGPNKGKKYRAIYELSGDTLKVCYALEGETRPSEFESKAGSKTFLVAYKRKK
ncbi:MAG TPA: TIGR03067 domain-containing protein [Gemmataceae bacterium]|jgi:uncharacterized protein (TIGR03067 family)|nr:TIGR03067 domain-containing protein [Gemmataceae bacterium]